ncbi:SPOR domain-containing protein [Thiobacter aerophilum]|uniref:SPOR domain-containing protein n=1 Tax=Thiobacter aerophilum TaxID=3121275 RepID=A0ABV0EFR3_9BURK
MRVVFFILLFANGLLLGYFLLRPQAAVSGPHPPLNPEAIRIAPSVVVAAPAAHADAEAGQCLEWSGLDAPAMARARAALEDMGLKDKLVLSPATDYWVHVPPLKTRAEAEKKLAELRALGIDDATLREDEGLWRHAISLAAFASREEAELYLAQLRAKGVKSARVLERQPPKSSITLIQLDETTQSKVEQLAASYANTELKRVACRLP